MKHVRTEQRRARGAAVLGAQAMAVLCLVDGPGQILPL